LTLSGDAVSPGAIVSINNGSAGRALTLTGSGTPVLQISGTGAVNANCITAANGHIEVVSVGKGFILKSPNGTRYRIAVADGGALSATAAS
jgi:hypothetical protein